MHRVANLMEFYYPAGPIPILTLQNGAGETGYMQGQVIDINNPLREQGANREIVGVFRLINVY